jgi:GT2 family glycosyltransferase
MRKGLVSIIIPHWNGKQMVEQTLRAIRDNTEYKDYEVIVIDNNSTDGSVQLLQQLKKEGFVDKLVLNSENKGFASANNQGFALSDAEFCFMLSNDTIPQSGWLSDAVEIALSDERIASVGIQTVAPPDFEKKRFKISDAVLEKQTVCGAAMLMRKEAIDLIGPLDAEHFSPVYGEETDWNFRARKAGFRVVESRRSIIVHIGSPSAKRRGGEKWQYVLMNTRRLRAMAYNLPPADFLRFAPGLGLIFLQSVKDLRPHWFLRGVWNNLKELPEIMRQRKKRKETAKKAREAWNRTHKSEK